jgi:hypothetical protein
LFATDFRSRWRAARISRLPLAVVVCIDQMSRD